MQASSSRYGSASMTCFCSTHTEVPVTSRKAPKATPAGDRHRLLSSPCLLFIGELHRCGCRSVRPHHAHFDPVVAASGKGEIVAVGNGEAIARLNLKVGDKVLFKKWGGEEIKVGQGSSEEIYKILYVGSGEDKNDIVAKFE